MYLGVSHHSSFMYLRLTALFFILFSFQGKAQFEGLIVNEFSQGDFSSREYIELLVAGKRTCKDSAADLRGWIFDDQNGWYGATNSAPGHYRFRDDPNWEKVPFGSIILLYNSASGEKNLSITLPDDPTDSDKDYTYILPINSSAYIEQHNSEPDNSSGASYAYPLPTSTSGYVPSTNQWQFRISLNNNGDVISLISPSNSNNAFFSIAYGYTVLPGFQNPTVSIGNVAAGSSAYLADNNYSSSASWMISTAPANETPGFLNSIANSTWIQSMRQQYAAIAETETIKGCGSVFYKGKFYTSSTVVRDTIKSILNGCDSLYHVAYLNVGSSSITGIAVCIQEGENYNFNGQLLETSGTYSATLTSSEGCDSIVYLTLTVTTKDTVNLSGCDSLVYDGITYTSSAVLSETLTSILTGCDSVLRTVNIILNTSPQITVSPDQIICKGNSAELIAAAEDAIIQWPVTGITGNSVIVSPLSTTSFMAIAVATNGCRDTAVTTVEVQDFNLLLTAKPNPAVTGSAVYLKANANSSYTIIEWQPSSAFSNQSALIQNLVADTSLLIKVVARSQSGCIDSAFARLIVDPAGKNIFIPTAFTPNNDGRNDVFRVLGGTIRQLDFKIYNRWGQMLFSTKDRKKGWDGTYAGTSQPTGTYVYYVRAVLEDGAVAVKKGTVNLIR